MSDTATAAQSDVKVAPLPSVAAGELAYAAGSEASSSSGVTSPDQQLALPAKTRSCDDLTKAGFDEDDDDVHPITSAQRRLSDSNLANHIAASAANEDKMLSVINCEPDGRSAESLCCFLAAVISIEFTTGRYNISWEHCTSSQKRAAVASMLVVQFLLTVTELVVRLNACFVQKFSCASRSIS